MNKKQEELSRRRRFILTFEEYMSILSKCTFRGPAQQGAYKRGMEARIEGVTRCPYGDLRGGRHDHFVTWSRSFQAAWWEGYKATQEFLTTRFDVGKLLPEGPK